MFADLLDALAAGFVHCVSVSNILAIFAGCMAGIIFGALPGFSASMGVATLLPFTFFLAPDTGLLTLAGVYVGAMYGGSIPAILIHTPGTPGAAATTLDGFPMAQKGLAGSAIISSATASSIGGFISGLILCLAGPVLSHYAAKISPAEIFLVAILGMTVLGTFAAKNPVKAYMGGIIGLLIGVIGADYQIGFYRFAFGIPRLYDGISLVAGLVGLLAVSECLVLVRHKTSVSGVPLKLVLKVKDIVREIWEVIGKRWRLLLRSSMIGAGIGFIPGEGAAVACFVSYDQARRTSKHPEQFGTGIREGVIAAEAANNAVVPMALLPALALGIPGSSTAALILSGIMMHGIRPGPGVFQREPNLMGTFLVGILATSLLLLLLGLFLVNPVRQLTMVRRSLLASIILPLVVIGIYAVNNSFFDVAVCLGCGLLGYGLKLVGVPPVTAVVGFVLGPIAEKGFTMALSISGGSPIIFFRPLGIFLWLLILASLILPWWRTRRKVA